MKFAGIKEYAAARGLSYSTIYDMCRSGALPSMKIGRRHKIEVEGADQYFKDKIDSGLAKTERLNRPLVAPKIAKTCNGAGGYLASLKLITKG